MNRDSFNAAMILKHGKTIFPGDVINIIAKNGIYEKLYVHYFNNYSCFLTPVAVNKNEQTYSRKITLHDLLTQFYSFGL